MSPANGSLSKKQVSIKYLKIVTRETIWVEVTRRRQKRAGRENTVRLKKKKNKKIREVEDEERESETKLLYTSPSQLHDVFLFIMIYFSKRSDHNHSPLTYSFASNGPQYNILTKYAYEDCSPTLSARENCPIIDETVQKLPHPQEVSLLKEVFR